MGLLVRIKAHHKIIEMLLNPIKPMVYPFKILVDLFKPVQHKLAQLVMASDRVRLDLVELLSDVLVSVHDRVEL